MNTLLLSSLLLVSHPVLNHEAPKEIPLPQADTLADTLAEILPESPQTEVTLSQNPSRNSPTCEPGQFVSAFPDVYPTDWAYQAVNRLASRPEQCFNLPPNN